MRCNGVQTVMWRLYIEDKSLEQGSWVATNDQLVARRKREEIETVAASSCPASSTSSASPSSSTFAVYLALKLVDSVINQPNGLPLQDEILYFDEVWEIAGDSTPDYCDTPTRTTLLSGATPNIEKPYPTTKITSLRPSKTSGPTCEWIPSSSDSIFLAPGILSCNANPTTVACVSADVPMTTCGNEDTRVYPAVQCMWQGD